MNNYQVLATKYRPKTLDAIIGQEFTVKTLKNAFQLNKIANAFIFTGNYMNSTKGAAESPTGRRFRQP